VNPDTYDTIGRGYANLRVPDPRIGARISRALGGARPEVQQLDRSRAPTIERLVELLGGAEVSTVPIPWDCSDGFQGAYWRRPERYLDPTVRASISTFAMLPHAVVARGMARLAADLASGAWAARNVELLQREALDLAYRLIVSREP
jgi:hypothetical protein